MLEEVVQQLARSRSIRIINKRPIHARTEQNNKPQPPVCSTTKIKPFEESPSLIFCDLPKPNKKGSTAAKTSPMMEGYPVCVSKQSNARKPTLIGKSEFNCSVCTEKMSSSAIVTIEGCNHSLHTLCLLPYLQQKIASGETRLSCPFANCQSELR